MTALVMPELKIVSRSEWRAQPAKRQRPAGKLHGICWHWSGRVNQAEERINQAARMRSMQSFHLRKSSWADIAYNFVIGYDGLCYEGRGFGVASGAEGRLLRRLTGRKYLSVCFNLGYRPNGQELKPTKHMLATAVRFVWLAQDRLPLLGHQHVCHGDVRRGGKDCPGPTLTPWVRSELPRLLHNPVIVKGAVPEPVTPQPVEDTLPWYADQLADAVAAGITDGRNPEEACTRAEAAIMIQRAIERTAK